MAVELRSRASNVTRLMFKMEDISFQFRIVRVLIDILGLKSGDVTEEILSMAPLDVAMFLFPDYVPKTIANSSSIQGTQNGTDEEQTREVEQDAESADIPDDFLGDAVGEQTVPDDFMDKTGKDQTGTGKEQTVYDDFMGGTDKEETHNGGQNGNINAVPDMSHPIAVAKRHNEDDPIFISDDDWSELQEYLFAQEVLLDHAPLIVLGCSFDLIDEKNCSTNLLLGVYDKQLVKIVGAPKHRHDWYQRVIRERFEEDLGISQMMETNMDKTLVLSFYLALVNYANNLVRTGQMSDKDIAPVEVT
jgi:hypothetical protein